VIGAIGVLSFAGWGSEVTNLRRARPLFALGVLLILLPVALLILNWLATAGRAARAARAGGSDDRKRMRSVPMLHVIGVVTLLAVGLAGELVAGLDSGGHSHRNYWGVATQHALFFGAATVGAVAAIYYWAPKLWGRHLSEGIGRLQFLALVGGLHLTVLAMFVLGIQDMAAHTSVYDDGELAPANLVASVGGAVVVVGVLLLILNLLVSVVAGRGREATSDPWGGNTLEWSTTSPPPADNFRVLPEVRSETPLLDLDQTETTSR
ncbi:MAG TPA: cbb3-type cytochrome c oxidase subunit I, partial [Acidimicrobiales bacterium]|nr:cbb3-type cytochrome c oxidase subunit I [Acidimicrobiales bacterium]